MTTIEQFLSILRPEFSKLLETAPYNKAGMQTAFERAIVQTLLQLAQKD